MKTQKLTWGHESRYCPRCGKVGPRCTTKNEIGYVHFYCLTSEEKKERRNRFKNVNQAMIEAAEE